VIAAGPGNTEQQLIIIETLKPVAYTGTPDFLKILRDAWIAAGKGEFPIKKAVVSGAAFPPSLQAEVKSWGIDAYQIYAVGDLGGVAYETPGREGMVLVEDLLLEIVKPGTGDPVADGEVGEVVLTSFDLRRPWVRLAVGDLSAVLAGRSPCGRTNARIKGWMGRSEVMAGNIGYLEVRSFGFPAEFIAEGVAAAMTPLADTDALIIDIRANGGGTPYAVAHLASYLFGPDSVHLNSIYWRPEDSTMHFWTSRDVPGRRFGPTKPVYVLVSGRTFSAAEEFAYDLQTRKRATIVGAATRGGANPGQGERLDDHFFAFVPSGRAINPVTGDNWEGVGVIPDVPVHADSALSAALDLARRQGAAARTR
jgi:hypothetical protein